MPPTACPHGTPFDTCPIDPEEWEWSDLPHEVDAWEASTWVVGVRPFSELGTPPCPCEAQLELQERKDDGTPTDKDSDLYVLAVGSLAAMRERARAFTTLPICDLCGLRHGVHDDDACRRER